MGHCFEETLVEQCAPTLAGLKPASLFRWQGAAPFLHWAKKLAPYGIAIRILKAQAGACLICLYRAGWLRQILAEPSNQAFLQRHGYQTGQGCGSLLEQLSRRLEVGFPHEIGLFLGYPLEDVEGFIQNQGRNYTACGCWKVYGAPHAAQGRFDCYRRCTALCRERFRQGADVTQLIPA